MQITSKFYGSNLLRHPDGTAMFRCSDSRLRWYIKRGLVRQITHGEYQFLFEPRGKGHANDAYYLEVRKNECVCCGSEDHLTKHHAVPACFRRYFPEQVKSRDHHDVLLLCEGCHRNYELHAQKLKLYLADKYEDPMSKVTTDHEKMRIRKWAHAVMNHSDKMPPARLGEILSWIEAYLGREATQEDIYELTEMDCQDGGGPYGERIVAAHAEDLHEFIRMWRSHFIDNMKPKYLSPNWSVEKPLRLDRIVD